VQKLIQKIYNFHSFSFCSYVVVTSRYLWSTVIPPVRRTGSTLVNNKCAQVCVQQENIHQNFV